MAGKCYLRQGWEGGTRQVTNYLILNNSILLPSRLRKRAAEGSRGLCPLLSYHGAIFPIRERVCPLEPEIYSGFFGLNQPMRSFTGLDYVLE